MATNNFSGVATGLVKTITQSTYSDFPSLVREIACNSLDAGSDKLSIISLNSSLLFLDNGKGLTFDEIINDMLFIGYSKSASTEEKIGKFGIGIFSVFPICEEFYIISKSKNTLSGAFVNTAAIFLEENSDKPIEQVLQVKTVEVNDIKLVLNTEYDVFSNIEALFSKLDTFTLVIAHKVRDDASLFLAENILHEDNEPQFNKICKILPLKVSEKDYVFDNIETELQNKIKDIFEKYCKKHIYLNWFYQKKEQILPLDYQFKHKYKPYKDNYSVDVIEETTIETITFAGYIFKYFGVIEDWEEIDLRINNTKIVDASIIAAGNKTRYPKIEYVTGELYIKGLKKYLKITRDSFVDNSNEFKAFTKKLREILKAKCEPQEKKRDFLQNAKQFFIEEQQSLVNSVEKSINNAIDILENLSNNEKTSLLSDVSKILHDKIKLSKTPDLVSEIDKNRNKKIIFPKENGEEMVTVEIVQNLDTPTFSKEGNIQVSSSFFKNKIVHTNCLGDIDIVYKKGSENDPAIDIDFTDKKIYINLFNSRVTSYEKSIFEVETILAVAFANSQDTKEAFYEKALEYLRGTKKESKNIFNKYMSILSKGDK